jgi:hypothetical protein
MSTSLDSVATIVQAVSIPVGFALVLRQLSQGRSALAGSRLAVETSSYQKILTLYLELAKDPDLAALYERANSDPDGLSSVDRARFFWLCRYFISFYEEIFLLHRYKVITDKDRDEWMTNFVERITLPGFAAYWAINTHGYDDEFVAYVTKLC